jgi:purine-binding chemotaxis protein CheW
VIPTSQPLDDAQLRDPDRVSADEAPVTYIDHFVFRLCRRAYALPPGSVDLVAPVQALTPVPTVPAHVLGVTYLRGRIVAVIDLAALIGVEGRPEQGNDPRLIVVGGDQPFAFVADGTLGIWSIAGEPARMPDDGACVIGRVEGPDGAATLLDPVALLERLLDARLEAA